MSSTTSLRSGLRQGDPSTYVDGVPHEAIDALRAETPVARQQLGGGPVRVRSNLNNAFRQLPVRFIR